MSILLQRRCGAGGPRGRLSKSLLVFLVAVGAGPPAAASSEGPEARLPDEAALRKEASPLEERFEDERRSALDETELSANPSGGASLRALLLGGGSTPTRPTGVLWARAGWSTLDGTVAVSTRQGGRWARAFEAANATLRAGAPETGRPDLPRFHLRWRGRHLELLGGSYTLGFAEGVTLDTSPWLDPSGAQPDFGVAVAPVGGTSEDELRSVLRWRPVFLGLVARFRHELPGLGLDAHAFVSHSPRSLAATQLVVAAECRDALKNGSRCPSPRVLDEATGELVSRATLDGVVDLQLAGARLVADIGRENALGFTAYAAQPHWRLDPGALDFAASSRLPLGGRWGAVGLDAKRSRENLVLGAEVTRTFDSGGGGGDFGGAARALWRGATQQLSVSGRYYGPAFLNPYTGSPSAPDQDEGQRARNELGLRVSHRAQPSRGWRVGWDADAARAVTAKSTESSAGEPSLLATGRIEHLGETLSPAFGGRLSRGLATATARLRCHFASWGEASVDYRATRRSSPGAAMGAAQWEHASGLRLGLEGRVLLLQAAARLADAKPAGLPWQGSVRLESAAAVEARGALGEVEWAARLRWEGRGVLRELVPSPLQHRLQLELEVSV